MPSDPPPPPTPPARLPAYCSAMADDENAMDMEGSEKQIFSKDFIIEVLATFPLEYIALGLNLPQGKLVWFLMNRILRVGFLPTYFQELTRWLEDRGTLKNVGMHRTWKLFSAMAMAGHWCGCIFYLVSEREAVWGEK